RSSSTTLPIPSKSDGSIVLSLLRIFLVFFCSSITASSEIYAISLSRLSILFTILSSVLIFFPMADLSACTAIIQLIPQLILHNGYLSLAQLCGEADVMRDRKVRKDRKDPSIPRPDCCRQTAVPLHLPE